MPSQPILGFVLGFVSHFALDSIPHWAEGKYLLRSFDRNKGELWADQQVKVNKNLVHDLFMVSMDSLLGFVLATLVLWGFFGAPLYIVLLGAFAGQLPDGLQFVYYIFKPRFMLPLQTFHFRIQEEHDDITYLGIEAGLILAVIALGILGVFML